jgi:hypothetical protein
MKPECVKCETCVFFEKFTHTSPEGVNFDGQCHHDAPTQQSVFPSVSTDDWCGSWDNIWRKFRRLPYNVTRNVRLLDCLDPDIAKRYEEQDPEPKRGK